MKKYTAKEASRIPRLLRLMFKYAHGSCEERTCEMIQAWNEGYEMWTLKLFADSGKAHDAFMSIYNTLPESFHNDAENERIAFRQNEHTKCPHCSVTIWFPQQATEDGITYCDACHKEHPENLRSIIKRISKKDDSDDMNGGFL